MAFHRISDSDFKKLYHRAPKHYKLIMLIQTRDGLRASEVLNLKVENLDFDKQLYFLDKQKNKVLNGARPMHYQNKICLKKYIDLKKDKIYQNRGYLFYSPWKKKKGHINIQTYCENIRNWSIELGIRNVIKKGKNGRKFASNTSHALRTRAGNNFIDEFYKKGIPVDPILIKAFFGHKNLNSTMKYIEESESKVAAVNRFREMSV